MRDPYDAGYALRVQEQLEAGLLLLESGSVVPGMPKMLAAYVRKQLAEDEVAFEHIWDWLGSDLPDDHPLPDRDTEMNDRSGLITAVRILGGFEP